MSLRTVKQEFVIGRGRNGARTLVLRHNVKERTQQFAMSPPLFLDLYSLIQGFSLSTLKTSQLLRQDDKSAERVAVCLLDPANFLAVKRVPVKENPAFSAANKRFIVVGEGKREESFFDVVVE